MILLLQHLLLGRATTVVVTLLSRGRTEVQTQLLARLEATSPYAVKVAFDTASGIPPQHPNLIALSNAANVRAFGRKVGNFNGKYTDNPARLGALRWFANSGFHYMWMLEDDAYVRNMSAFAATYDDVTADFVGAGGRALPFWVAKGWRVGRPEHAVDRDPFSTAFWCVCRFSKRLAEALIQRLHAEPASSHHEIFLPYVLYRDGLPWHALTDQHRRHLALNAHDGKQHFLTLDQAIHRPDVLVAHPIKELGDRSSHTNNNTVLPLLLRRCRNHTNVLAACVAGEACGTHTSFAACQRACAESNGCAALVYNKYGECYLKRHARPRQPDPPYHQTVAISLEQDIAANPSVFGKLLRRELPVAVLHDEPDYWAFRNIKPYAPLAGLVIPKRYVPHSPEGLAKHLDDLRRVALLVLEQHQPEAYKAGDYWLRFHRPPFSSVDHLHLHCLAPISQAPLWTKFVFLADSPWALDLDKR
ncbi:hypothetical protein CTAYLR_000710 [Chrysophaeum taylorii]|uniref:HIT domain-containing protein n=1 Tax=Chrysophaeum taylorii TaxID=2483200 RepID=A0AAD7XGD2_9STRA|nr:hypothetical protein CTAYLR_000710 [Chrysophaeum taylorii]